MQKYDLIVIGGGPAGYLAAERAAQGGLYTALFEKEHIGGTCLNTGCIPSKTFLTSAKIYNHAKLEGEAYGVISGEMKIDHPAVVNRKKKVVKTLVGGVSRTLKKLKVDVHMEAACIEGKTDGLFIVAAGGEKYSSRYLFVATGSSAVIPPIEGLRESIESGFALTNEGIFDLPEVPEHLAVLGGGVIGMEMASYFRAAGSKVDVIEMLPSIGGAFGSEMAGIVEKEYREKGFVFHLNCKVTKVSHNTVQFEDSEGKTNTLQVDRVLVSLGRRANLSGFGLENLPVVMNRTGITVNEHIETSVPGLYAPGDVNGKATLAHIAYREAEVAVNHILGKKDSMSYQVVPNILYTDPEVSCVGETPESAAEKGFDIKVVHLPMQFSGRYVAETENGRGTCTLVYDRKNDRLLGAQVCATGSSEFIYGIGAFIDMEVPLERLKRIIFPHPTTGEIIRESLFEI